MLKRRRYFFSPSLSLFILFSLRIAADFEISSFEKSLFCVMDEFMSYTSGPFIQWSKFVLNKMKNTLKKGETNKTIQNKTKETQCVLKNSGRKRNSLIRICQEPLETRIYTSKMVSFSFLQPVIASFKLPFYFLYYSCQVAEVFIIQ